MVGWGGYGEQEKLGGGPRDRGKDERRCGERFCTEEAIGGD